MPQCALPTSRAHDLHCIGSGCVHFRKCLHLFGMESRSSETRIGKWTSMAGHTIVLSRWLVLLLAVTALCWCDGVASPAVAQQLPPISLWTDPSTHLSWTTRDNGKGTSWKAAEKYCRKLRVGGYTGWRLANLDELRGIYDKAARSPGLLGNGEPFVFEVKGGLFLTGNEWSSERQPNDRGHPSGYEWYFDLINGIEARDPSGWPYSSASKRALCVLSSVRKE